MSKFLSDEETRRVVRDFIVTNGIVRQTVENWLLIRNQFDLSDSEEDGVFRLMRTYNHGVGPSRTVTYSGSHPNLMVRTVESSSQAPNVPIDLSASGSSINQETNDTCFTSVTDDGNSTCDAVSEIGNLLTDGNVERLVREFIIEHLIVRQTEENWLIIRNKFELRDTEQKKVYGLIRQCNHPSGSHPELFGPDGIPGPAMRHTGSDPNIAIRKVEDK